MEEGPVCFFKSYGGKAYTLKVGDEVFDGRVTNITDNELVFEQWIFDDLNRPRPPKKFTIKLHRISITLRIDFLDWILKVISMSYPAWKIISLPLFHMTIPPKETSSMIEKNGSTRK